MFYYVRWYGFGQTYFISCHIRAIVSFVYLYSIVLWYNCVDDDDDGGCGGGQCMPCLNAFRSKANVLI